MATSIIQYSKHGTNNHIYGGELVNGGAVRYLSLIVIYDERGPITTNYTASGCHDWGFETKRRVSTKAVEVPDWTNPNGFLVKDDYDRFFGGYPYTLYLNRDNIPDDSYVEGEWHKYMMAIQREDRVGGCLFNRILSYPMYRKSERALSAAMDHYYDHTIDGRNHLHALHHSSEVLADMNDIAIALHECDAYEQAFHDASIDELIEVCGADKPINENDWCGLVGKDCTSYRPYLIGTYEL